MNLEYWRTYVDEIEATPVEPLLGKASPAVRTALESERSRSRDVEGTLTEKVASSEAAAPSTARRCAPNKSTSQVASKPTA